MKRRNLPKRLVAVLLVLCVLFSFAVPAGAVGGGRELSFRQVDNSAVSENAQQTLTESETPEHADTDMVRVSIFLKSKSVVEAGYDTQEIAGNASAMSYRVSLRNTQDSVAASIERITGETLDVVWNMTLMANAISANVRYGQIEEIERLSSVEKVVLENCYAPQETVTTAVGEPNMVVSTQMTGANVAWESGYTGAGMRIAIIDTGLDIDHQSVDPNALAEALKENAAEAGVSYEDYVTGLDLLDEAEIAEALPQLNAAERYAGLTAADLYVNLKAPFGFNYVDASLDLTHDHDSATEHGSHVAGIAAANRLVKQGTEYVPAAGAVGMVGNAPDAQIIVMKVFGQNGGAYDSDYMAAVEDAILLGCDAINLSLGSTLAGESGDDTYAELLDSLARTNTVVSMSIGNNGYWAQNADPKGYLFAEDVNFHTGGSPGTFTNSLAVASVDNDGVVGNTVTVDGGEFVYTESLYRNPALLTLDTSADGAGTEYDYVMIDGYGEVEDYAGMDVENKILICSRGELEFTSKLYNADSVGAKALMVYNNAPGLFYMDLTYYWGSTPCVALTEDAAAYIRAHGTEAATENGAVYYTGKLTIGHGVSSIYSDSEYLSMSSFSSWGVPGDLSLKPEITAPGGNIYSLNGAVEATDQYELMSGTSMAAPQLAGISALMLQHIQTKGLSQEGLTDRALAQSVLMSTARPLKDGDGQYYPVIQQGAGLVDTAAAIHFDSYLLVEGQPDGKVKAELGDDPDRTGVYSFQFEIHNITDEQKTYQLSADVFTQDVFEDYANYNYNEAQRALYTDIRTTPLAADVSWTADGKVISASGETDPWDFNGDGDVDEADGQALLDYVTGARATIEAAAYADIDKDGDVDTYDVYLFLCKASRQSVAVPAGGSATVSVTIRLTADAKALLDERFENGAYVQAYVYAEALADAEGVQGTSHSIPVLAFYGNWSDSSMLDLGCLQTFETGEEYRVPYLYSRDINTYTITYADEPNTLYVFGGNPLIADEKYMPERNAMNSENGSKISKLMISVIRNAAASKGTVTNLDTGEILQETDFGELPAAAYHLYGYSPTSYALRINWKPKDLPEGTRMELELAMAPDYYINDDGSVRWDELGKGAVVKTPFTIDNTAPVLEGVELDEASDLLEVTVTDNQYVSAILLYNQSGVQQLASVGSDPDAEAGDTSTFYLDVSQVDGQQFLLQVMDYAMNTATYAVGVDLGQLTAPERIAFNMGSSKWINFDQNISWSYNNWMPSDRTFTAATIRNHTILAVSDQGELCVMPETDPSVVTVVANLGVTLTDMAVNPVDGKVYGVSNGTLVEVNPLTGAVTEIGEIGVETNTLACDANGTFYCHEITDGEVKQTDVYSFTLDTVKEPVLALEVAVFTNDYIQALEIDPNTGKLCWISYFESTYGSFSYSLTYYLQIDLETGEFTQSGNLFSHLSCLAIPAKDSEGEWETTDQVSGIQLSQSSMTVLRNTKEQLNAYVLPWTASDRAVRWSTSDPSVATVDQNGVVTGVKVGRCVITAASELDPSVTASCAVTVETPNVTLEGALTDGDGKTMLFTWNLETGDSWTEGVTLDTSLTASTLDAGSGDLYAADAEAGVWAMHRIDVSTGETLENSGRNGAEIPLWDMAYSSRYSEKASPRISMIYGEYLLPAKDPMNLDFMAFDLYNILAPYGADSLTAIASLGYETYWDEEDGVNLDTEHLVLLDNTGSVWNFWLYDTEDGGMSGVLNGYPSTLAGLAFPGDDDGNMNCSMIAGEDGCLYLTYYTGAETQLYRLRFDEAAQNYRAVLMGSFGEDVKIASLYAAESNTAVSAHAETMAPMHTGDEIKVEAQVVTAETLAASSGSLNVAAANTSLDRSGAGDVVTLRLTARQLTTNGLYTVSYDPAKLTLVGQSARTELSSFVTGDGVVTFGFADTEGVPEKGVAATLRFRVLSGAEAAFTVTREQENEKHPGTVEQITLFVDQGGQTAGNQPDTQPGDVHDCPSKAFTDLNPTEWYHEGVDFALDNGLMRGVGNGRFAPNGTATRAMIVTMLYRMAGSPEVTYAPLFTDVDGGQYYANAVTWAYENGIVKGVSADRFAPDAAVTREQFATFLYRYAEFTGADVSARGDLGAFADGNTVSDYAREAMTWAVGSGLLVGNNGKLLPGNTATRAQLAVILFRFLNP